MLLGGGGTVSDNDANTEETTAMQASWPSSATTWTVTGAVLVIDLNSPARMTVQAYALCSL